MVISGLNPLAKYKLKEVSFPIPVYDITQLCSSWSAAATSTISLSVSRWNSFFINYSIQFIIDCDVLGDPCSDRSAVGVYSMFTAKIPRNISWDVPGTNTSSRKFPLDFPVKGVTDQCPNGCYPGHSGCIRDYALSGSCIQGSFDCPIYFLQCEHPIENFIWEVGPVSSSILVGRSFFAYQSGIYVSLPDEDVIGEIHVTIIGWGYDYDLMMSFWWVVPHLGTDFGESFSELEGETGIDIDKCRDLLNRSECYSTNLIAGVSPNDLNQTAKGLMKIRKGTDELKIESQSVGPVPFNFSP